MKQTHESGESRCILVLGVHGSGTSAVAGVLDRLGVSMGDRLVGPNRHNPRGHYEDADFRALLYMYRSDRALRDRIIAFLEARFAREVLWGLKEPAILEVINDLGAYLDTRPYRTIATDRDPLASARSYAWKWATAEIAEVVRFHDLIRSQRECFLQRYRPPTLWIRYNDLTRQPAEEVRRITEFVFAGRPAPPVEVVRRATDFIDPGLNHYRERAADRPEEAILADGEDPRLGGQRSPPRPESQRIAGPTMPIRPSVSIIIPVHNEGGLVRATLEAILATAAPAPEIIVVDDDSTDGGCDFLRGGEAQFAGVRLVPQARGGVAGARNRGAAMATGDFLVFLDAHCYPGPGWIEELIAAASSLGDGLFAPCVVDANDPRCKGYGAALLDWDLQYRWLSRPGDHPHEVPLIGGGCMVVRRDYFESLGHFDAMRTFGCEDVEICLRCWLAGDAVWVVPTAEVRHVFKPRLNYMTFAEDRVYNALRTALVHLDGPFRDRALDHLRKQEGYLRAVDRILRSDIWERRHWVRSRRGREPQWYWQRFQVSL